MFIKILSAGYGLRDFAEAHGCELPFVSLVVNGHRRSAALEALIAETLGEPVANLFPPVRKRARAA